MLKWPGSESVDYLYISLSEWATSPTSILIKNEVATTINQILKKHIEKKNFVSGWKGSKLRFANQV